MVNLEEHIKKIRRQKKQTIFKFISLPILAFTLKGSRSELIINNNKKGDYLVIAS